METQDTINEGMGAFANVLDTAKELIMTYGLKILTAIVVLVIGLWIIKAITKNIGKAFERRNVDASLRPFLKGLLGALLKVMLLISVISMMGIEATSFIAVLGAAGLAIGMALSGTLQNFAGGVMILIFKPYKVGDWIDAMGYQGSVKEIQIFNTILKTPDNKTIILPNGPLSGSSMVNYSTEQKRRVDWTFGIGYGDDVEKARAILMRLMNEENRIINDPDSPFVGLVELADSSVNLATRAWVNASDYWGVFFSMQEKVYNAFNAEGIKIPYPQMDVHVQNA